MCSAKCSGTWYLDQLDGVHRDRRRVSLLVTANSDFGTPIVLMFMEFSEQQSLCFFDCYICGDPSLVIGVDNPGAMDTEVGEPLLNTSYGLFLGGEGIVNLF